MILVKYINTRWQNKVGKMSNATLMFVKCAASGKRSPCESILGSGVLIFFILFPPGSVCFGQLSTYSFDVYLSHVGQKGKTLSSCHKVLKVKKIPLLTYISFF